MDYFAYTTHHTFWLASRRLYILKTPSLIVYVSLGSNTTSWQRKWEWLSLVYTHKESWRLYIHGTSPGSHGVYTKERLHTIHSSIILKLSFLQFSLLFPQYIHASWRLYIIRNHRSVIYTFPRERLHTVQSSIVLVKNTILTAFLLFIYLFFSCIITFIHNAKPSFRHLYFSQQAFTYSSVIYSIS